MKILNLLIAILFTSILFSCSSKDDDNSNRGSGFSVEEKYYSTPNGYILSEFEGADNKLHAIYLSNGTVVNNEWHGNNYCDFSNNLTQDVIFYIHPALQIESTDGTYTYELNTGEPYILAVFFGINIKVLGNCRVSGASISTPQFKNGSLTVKVSGNIYTITYTFQLLNDEIIEGNYTGELQLVQDFS